MPSRRISRLVEHGKSILIFLLICSAVYLFGRTQMYADFTAGGWLESIAALLPGAVAPPDGAEGQPGRAGILSVVRPVRIVAGSTAARWGAQYGPESDVFFELAGGLLAEALCDAEPPRAASSRAFRAALEQPGIYFDFLGQVPLRSLCAFLSDGENPALGHGAARRLLLSRTASGGAELLYLDEESGMYYACVLPAAFAARIGAAAGERQPNGAQFAYEAGEVFGRVSPYLLLMPEPPRPQNYTARAPLGQIGPETLSEPMEQLLRALGFNPRLSGIYPVTDGIAVREGTDTLRVSSAGVVTYRVPEGGESRYPAADAVETAAQMAEAMADVLAGSARLYLIDVHTEEERTAVRFGYCLDGAEVTLPGGLTAAEVVVSRGGVVEFTLFPRAYEPAGTTAVLLPELQAVAAMEALGVPEGELLLHYEDDGSQCVPVWGAK